MDERANTDDRRFTTAAKEEKEEEDMLGSRFPIVTPFDGAVQPKTTPDGAASTDASGEVSAATVLLRCIDPRGARRLVYTDRLGIFDSKTDAYLGDFSVDVVLDMHKTLGEVLHVYSECSGDVDGMVCGSSVNAYVHPKGLQTIKQIQTEFLKFIPEGETELTTVKKTIELKERVFMDNAIHVRIDDESPDAFESNEFTVHPSMVEEFIGSGASFCLMRVIALGIAEDSLRRMLTNTFNFYSLDGVGQLCHSCWTVDPISTNILDGEIVETVNIRRELEGANGTEHWHFELTTDGRLLTWEHKGSPVIMRIITSAKTTGEETIVVLGAENGLGSDIKLVSPTVSSSSSSQKADTERGIDEGRVNTSSDVDISSGKQGSNEDDDWEALPRDISPTFRQELERAIDGHLQEWIKDAVNEAAPLCLKREQQPTLTVDIGQRPSSRPYSAFDSVISGIDQIFRENLDKLEPQAAAGSTTNTNDDTDEDGSIDEECDCTCTTPISVTLVSSVAAIPLTKRRQSFAESKVIEPITIDSGEEKTQVMDRVERVDSAAGISDAEHLSLLFGDSSPSLTDSEEEREFLQRLDKHKENIPAPTAPTYASVLYSDVVKGPLTDVQEEDEQDKEQLLGGDQKQSGEQRQLESLSSSAGSTELQQVFKEEKRQHHNLRVGVPLTPRVIVQTDDGTRSPVLRPPSRLDDRSPNIQPAIAVSPNIAAPNVVNPTDVQWHNIMKKVSDECVQWVADHPELNSTLTDFLQCLLIAKPENIAQYAAVYFHMQSIPSVAATTVANEKTP